MAVVVVAVAVALRVGRVRKSACSADAGGMPPSLPFDGRPASSAAVVATMTFASDERNEDSAIPGLFRFFLKLKSPRSPRRISSLVSPPLTHGGVTNIPKIRSYFTIFFAGIFGIFTGPQNPAPKVYVLD